MAVNPLVKHLSAEVAPEGEHLVGRSLSAAVAAIRAKSVRTATGCLLWQGNCNAKGYGRVAYNGRYPTTHRVIFVAAHGPLTPDIQVLHRCDTPNCVEETHLFRGDNSSNQQDRVRKGRFTKLSPQEVEQVKTRLKVGESQVDIAASLGVSQALVSRMGTGDRYGCLTGSL